MKAPLEIRMAKKKAPKAWIAEVLAMKRKLGERDLKLAEYLEIIDNLARQVDGNTGPYIRT